MKNKQILLVLIILVLVLVPPIFSKFCSTIDVIFIGPSIEKNIESSNFIYANNNSCKNGELTPKMEIACNLLNDRFFDESGIVDIFGDDRPLKSKLIFKDLGINDVEKKSFLNTVFSFVSPSTFHAYKYQYSNSENITVTVSIIFSETHKCYQQD